MHVKRDAILPTTEVVVGFFLRCENTNRFYFEFLPQRLLIQTTFFKIQFTKLFLKKGFMVVVCCS